MARTYRVERRAFIKGCKVGPGTPRPTVELNGDEFKPWPEWLSPVDAPAPAANASNDGANGGSIKAGKAAVELAESLGVDLHQIQGSGKDGNITKKDVQAYHDSLPADPGDQGDSSDDPGGDDADEA